MKINRDKRIGRVLFIVEGGRYEFNLLKRIFCELLGYEYLEKRRNQPEQFISGKDPYSMIAVVNTRESNIKDITDHEEYLDEIFEFLLEKYQFPVDQSAIYYLFDRDPRSNKDPQRIKTYIATLKNPYENEGALKAGQLLLSYPSAESYIISGFEENTYQKRFKLGKKAKSYIGKKIFS